MGKVVTTVSVSDINKITGLQSVALDIDEAVENRTIVVKSVEALLSVTKTAKDMQRVEMIENGKINVFLFDESRKSENDGLSVYNGFVRQGDIESYITDKYGIKKSTIEKFKMVSEFDKYFYTDEKIIQVLEAKGYGYSGDDGYSSSEHLITGTKIYVSSSSGSDDNDGLTPTTAYKTLRKASIDLNNAVAGSGILCKRGDVWDTETSLEYASFAVKGNSDNSYVITSYGIGNLPRFTSLKEQNDTLAWTDNGDGTWYAEPSSPTISIPDILLNDVYIIASKILEELKDMPVNSWYHDTSNSLLYINFDPTEIMSIKYSETMKLITMSDTEYLDISYLNIENHRWYSISGFGNNYNVRVHNCILGKNTKRGVSINGKNAIITNNLIDANAPFYTYNKTGDTTYPCGGYEAIVINDIAGGINSSIVANNTIKNWRHASIMTNGVASDNSLSTDMLFQKNILYINPAILQYGGRIDIQNKIGEIKVKENIMLYTPALQYGGPRHEFSGNVFYKIIDSSSSSKSMNIGFCIDCFPTDPTYDTADDVIDNNVFYKCDSYAVSLKNPFYSPITSNKITSNIVYDNCQLGYPWYPTDPGNGVQIHIAVNDVYDTPYPLSGTIVENNILWSKASDTVIVAGSTYVENDYLTVEEAESKVYTDGTVMSGNLQIDLLKYLEVA